LGRGGVKPRGGGKRRSRRLRSVGGDFPPFEKYDTINLVELDLNINRNEKMRKNIFEIMASEFNVNYEITTIWKLYEKESIIYFSFDTDVKGNITYILDDLHKNKFTNWKARNRCVSTHDMMNRLGINSNTLQMTNFSNETLKLLEFILNMINLCNIIIDENRYSVTNDYILLNKNIDIFIEHFGYTKYENEDEETVIIIEKNEAAIAVAEISEPEIAKKIIQYNHYLLKGDIETKRGLLLIMANELEPKRKELESINSSVTTDLFFMFNNMNIRHNNIDQNDKNYKPFIADMDKNDLENWYDEIYQMILFAKLLLDNKERQNRIRILKENI
jgi:hypothetical protein